MHKKLLLSFAATLVCSQAFADNWVFRGTPNNWLQDVPMTVVPGTSLVTTCQNFSGVVNPRFKIDNITKGSWVDSFPTADFIVADNTSFDITFNPAVAKNSAGSIVVVARSTPCGTASSSSISSVSSSSSVSSVSSATPVHLRGTQNGWLEGDLMTPTGPSTYEICRNFISGDATGGPRFKIDPNGAWGADSFPASDVPATGWTKIVVNIATKTILSKTTGMAANCAVASSSSSSVASSFVSSSSKVSSVSSSSKVSSVSSSSKVSSVSSSSKVSSSSSSKSSSSSSSKSSSSSSSALSAKLHVRGTHNGWLEGDLMTPVVGSTTDFEACRNFIAGDANGAARFKVDPNGGWGDGFPAADVPANGWTKIVVNSVTKSVVSTKTNLGTNCATPTSIFQLRGTHNQTAALVWLEGDFFTPVAGSTTDFEICRNFLPVAEVKGPRFRVDPNGGWGTDAFPVADVATTGWTKVVINGQNRTVVSVNSNLAANCATSPVTSLNIDRSLMIHDEATLNVVDASGPVFDLKRVLSQLAVQFNASNPTRPTSAGELFGRLWDSQNDPLLRATAFTDGPKCTRTLNGFPHECRTDSEGRQAFNSEVEMANYKPIALVNRFDLHDAAFTNCGEYRIIFGRKNGNSGRNFIIFEAQLRNQLTGANFGCTPVVNFWANLTNVNDAATRGQLLGDFYFKGLPSSAAAPATGPIFHIDNYGATTGQIRTNQFMGGPWLLKEFKTSTEGGLSHLKPVSVKSNPFGELFDDSLRTDALAVQFRQQFLNNMASLVVPDINAFSLTVQNDAHNNGQSHSQEVIFPGENDYPTHAKPTFRAAIQARAAALGSPLTADQILNRAKAMSCGGCHSTSNFTDVGFGQVWPSDAGFVHVSEFVSGGIFPISPALQNVFLPARKLGMESFLQAVPAAGSVAPASTESTTVEPVLTGKRSG